MKENKLITALDLTDKKSIYETARGLKGFGKFKIGSVAFTKFGPALVKKVREYGDVFLDLKFYDIPNTMAYSAIAAASLGVWGFTVHIQSGKEALGRVREAINSFHGKKPLIIGVSELTSKQTSLSRVMKLVKLAYNSGLDGVVSSVWEAREIKREYNSLIVITPGIRVKKADDDQKRVSTAKKAFSEGADFIVVGRPILNSTNKRKAAINILSA